jgi:hypothetical protein
VFVGLGIGEIRATPEMRAAQEIEDRTTVEGFDALARNLERNMASEIGDGQAACRSSEDFGGSQQ